MKTRMWMLLTGTALAVVAVLAFGSAAMARGTGLMMGTQPMGRMGGGMMAQGSDPTMMQGGRMGGQMGGPMNGSSLIDVAAQELGMDRAALLAELQQGKTIADVAAAHNVPAEKIVNAFVATRAARMATMVQAGRITQDQANERIALMKDRVTAMLSQPWSPQGPGFVDEDGDGVCDNAGTGTCPNPGQGPGQGRGPRA